MGYNTTVVIMNDGLGNIEKDPDFAKKLVAAILENAGTGKPVDVSALGHVNAATVIEQHHADRTALIAVGGNYGTKIYEQYGWKHHKVEDQWPLLENALDATTRTDKGASSSG